MGEFLFILASAIFFGGLLIIVFQATNHKFPKPKFRKSRRFMTPYEKRGSEIRKLAKTLVFDFMQSSPQCQKNAEGMKFAQIFRECGFDWGDYPKTTSSNQKYWVVAIVEELKAEGKVERVSQSGPWRLL